jgi:DNA repair exonuclease SbcCD ATPase subunit
MKLKHKVIKEFQFLTPDKKILILKANTVLEEYVYSQKDEKITIDKDIVDNNPEFFKEVDWKADLLSYLKTNKIPQPAVLSKKLFPFIEEFINTNSEPVQNLDVNKLKDLENKEFDLERREKRIVDREEELELRINRIEKRESEYKEDIKYLNQKETDLKQRLIDLTNKELELQELSQDLNERERNIESEILNNSTDMDVKYEELQKKIEEDLKKVTEKENELEKKTRELKLLEDEVNKDNSDILEYNKYISDKLEEISLWKSSIEIFLPDRSHYSVPPFPTIEKKTF